MSEDVSTALVGTAFRPIPFWSWNDELDAEELVRQIHEMHDAGMGGFFMHARTGLKTPYMGERWMGAISVCVREAKKLGMKAWLYDENGWPSGFADGSVNGRGVEYQLKTLRFNCVDDLPKKYDSSCVVAWYDADYQLLPSNEGSAWVAWFEANPFYVDNMSPLVTGAFIEDVHERYWRELPEDVRQGLEGIFTDEPQLSQEGVEWSLILPEEYEKAYGEPLLGRLPELFVETPECHRTRIRFYRLCSQLFRKNYLCRLGDWCEAHGWKLTGHNVMEEMLHGQVYSSGSVMPQYTGYAIPGIDHLDRFSPYITSEIQVVSVAAQTGKPQILTETFGCTGWNFNQQGMKWLYQQQLVHGVNLLCQHLAGYSLHGLRKRDYPPSIAYHHPMWKHIRGLHDAFSRVGRMLATGTIECDVLVLHPESSAWADAIGDNRFTGIAEQCYDAFAKLSTYLDDDCIPFHYGDEILMEEMASVEGATLRVGKMAYSIIVLPLMRNISKSVLALLKEFRANGGRIFNHDGNSAMLTLADGMPLAADDKSFLESLETYEDGLLPGMLSELVRCVEINYLGPYSHPVHATWRAFPERGEHWYYIVDTAHDLERKADDPICNYQYFQGPAAKEDGIDIEVSLPYHARAVRLIDQTTGAVLRTLDVVNEYFARIKSSVKTSFVFHLPSCGSLLIQAIDLPDETAAMPLSDGWTWEEGDNVLTLDRASIRINDEADFSPEADVLAIFNRLLAMPDCDIAVRYSFNCGDSLDFNQANLRIALEPAQGARYFLNGKSLQPVFDGWFIDRSIRCLALPADALKPGVNEFEMNYRFAQSPAIRAALERARHFESEANKLFFDSELENVYILGRFGCTFRKEPLPPERFGRYIRGPFTLVPPPATVSTSSLVDSGFPFFSGYLTLTRTVQLTADEARRFSTLKLSPFRADSVQLTVNGKTLPPVFAAPYEIDVEGLLTEGENSLALTFGVSPRNTLGPLHTYPAEPDGTRITSFLMEPDILGRPTKTVIDAYSLLEPGTAVVIL